MNIVVLGFEGCLPSGVMGLVDLFWLASRLPGQAPWKVRTASLDGHALRDGQGRLLPVDMALSELQSCDAVLIPGLVPASDGSPPRTAAMQEAGGVLRRLHAHGALVGGSCAGVFVLGEAGLLDGRRCTTTWWLHDALIERYPRADVRWGSALLEADRVVTAGGPLSWVDLALHTIRQLAGPEAARQAADFAVVDPHPGRQTLHAPSRYAQHHDPLLQAAERVLRQTPGKLGIAELAAALALSERTLHRRFKAATDESPKAFINRTRLEMARTLLDVPQASIKRVAQQCGYWDEGSFRRAFTRFAGMSPSAYRQWSHSHQEPSP